MAERKNPSAVRLLSYLPAAAPASVRLYGWSESSLSLRVKITNAPLSTTRLLWYLHGL